MCLNKERAVRRIFFALLVSVVTAVVPLSSPVGAEVVVKAPKVLPPAPVRPRRIVATPLRHALVAEASSVSLNIDQLRAKWQHVAICEVDGNWSMTGPSYSGIGFLNSTWHQYGGTQFAPLAGEASRDQQIVIGMRVTSGRIPDQDGCSPDGW
jgi:hypothetical protein